MNADSFQVFRSAIKVDFFEDEKIGAISFQVFRSAIKVFG